MFREWWHRCSPLYLFLVILTAVFLRAGAVKRDRTLVSPAVQRAGEVVFGDEHSLLVLFLEKKHLHVLHIDTRK